MHIHIKTKEQATQHWIDRFNAVSSSMFERAFARDGILDIDILATPSKECSDCGTNNDVDAATCTYCGSSDLYWERDLPMWGTLWSFGERVDEDWARDNAQAVSACGFRVYEAEDGEVFIGINGAGYDFYETHWIPLYEARGLQWHETEEERG